MTACDVVIVGGSVAGVATADELRRRGFPGSIVLVDSEAHLPYDKPPLSKKALTSDWDPAQAQLRPRQHYDDLSIQLRLGQTAQSLETSQRSVLLESGEVLSARHVVLTTGASPRALPLSQPVPGVHTLRGLDDALAIRRRLGPGRRLVVVGGGFIGAEVAATARQEGAEVTVVEAMPLPFAGVLGPEAGAALAGMHTRRGVQLACGVPVARVERSAAGAVVVLADGKELVADVVVVGLGVRPRTDWLAGSGLLVADGIVCDELGRTSAPNVYAAGDVASWYDSRTQGHSRGEHWTVAREQGTAVARVILGDAGSASLSAAPYFWSDQFGVRIQCFGYVARHDDCELAWGSPADEQFVMLYFRLGRLVGAVGVNAARQLRRYHADIETQTARSSLDLPLSAVAASPGA